MKHQSNTEVLVVGAGPVGMMLALRLRQEGIAVQIIDEAERTAVRSYACAVHPHSLRLLREIGLLKQVEEAGWRVDRIAFYDGNDLKASLDFSKLPVEFPYVMVLPQATLENLLEAQLKINGGAGIQWRHRLSGLSPSASGAIATVAHLGISSTGLVIEEFEQIVRSETEISAAFVVGTDGAESFVRNFLQIGWESLGEAGLFTVCDFQSDAQFGNEARVLLEEERTEMLWPLSDHMGRWILTSGCAAPGTEVNEKDRMPVVVLPPEEDKIHFQESIHARAPWFTQSVNEIDWLAEVPFEPRLANRFGKNRCWLAGDSAHQASPLGMQSMNVGLSEAVELADILKRILREGGSPALLESYSKSRRKEWQFLLSIPELPHTDEWVRSRSSRIISSIPASGPELILLAQQLGLDLSPASKAA